MEKTSYIRFDRVVKKILRDTANFEVLEGLISTLIGEQVSAGKPYEGIKKVYSIFKSLSLTGS